MRSSFRSAGVIARVLKSSVSTLLAVALAACGGGGGEGAAVETEPVAAAPESGPALETVEVLDWTQADAAYFPSKLLDEVDTDSEPAQDPV
jgi:hypothetical protein